MKKVLMFIATCIIRLFLILFVIITIYILRDISISKHEIKKTKMLTDGRIIYTDVVNLALTVYSLDIKAREIKKIYVSQKEDSNAEYFDKLKKENDEKKSLGIYNFVNVNKGKGLIEYAYISKMNSDWVLLGINNYSEDLIYKLNIKTGEMVYLRKGSLPTYMPRYNKMFFFLSGKHICGESTKGELYMVDMGDLNKPKFIAKVITERGENVIIPISYSEIMFWSYEEDSSLIYNIETDRLKKWTVEGYSPWKWRDKTKQLICNAHGEKFLVSLDGKRIEKIPSPKFVRMYISEKDIFVNSHGVARFYWQDGLNFNEVSELSISDLKTGKKELLGRDTSLNYGIYLPE